MQWLINLISLLTRGFNAVRRWVVLCLLFLVYLFGVGLVALGIRVRSLAGGGGSGPALQPAGSQDLTESGLRKMV